MNKFIYLFLIILLFLFMSSNVFSEAKPKVAVLSIEEGDLNWKGFRADEILNGITQQITDKLVQIPDIKVIERSRIKEIITEQDFSYSGRIDLATAAEIGEILGVDYLILGTLTTMSIKEQGGLSIGAFSISGIKAEVVLTGRIVDVNTGEIIDSFKGEGENTSASLSISDLEGISFGTKAFSESVLGKSIDQATTDFVEKIDPQKMLSNYSSNKQITGKVIKVLGDKIIIDIGRNKNLMKDQIGEVIRLIEVEGLDEPVEMPIGKIKIFSIDDKASIVKILEMYDNEMPQKGDVVSFDN